MLLSISHPSGIQALIFHFHFRQHSFLYQFSYWLLLSLDHFQGTVSEGAYKHPQECESRFIISLFGSRKNTGKRK
jgi:hypothetical protein